MPTTILAAAAVTTVLLINNMKTGNVNRNAKTVDVVAVAVAGAVVTISNGKASLFPLAGIRAYAAEDCRCCCCCSRVIWSMRETVLNRSSIEQIYGSPSCLHAFPVSLLHWLK